MTLSRAAAAPGLRSTRPEMPKRTDINSILIIGAGPDRHRPGLRVRLFRRAGLQGAEGRGLPDHPGQLQPGDDHDRSGAGRRHLYRADHAGDRREDHREGAARRAAADHGRADGAEHARWRWTRSGVLDEVRRRDDRRQGRRRSTRPRTASCSARRWTRSASRRRASRLAHTLDEALTALDSHRPARRSSARPSRSAAPAAASPTTSRSSCEIVERGLDASPTTEVLIEESVLGWKEYEMEVVRDKADNCIIICSIENIDPMGVHTGDSITVAPALTLTDKEYQMMRDASIAVLREIGVETGGSNVQFAVNPADGRHGRHRDEPARVALLGAGLQGHRLPDRQGRGASSPSATRSTSWPTTSPAARRRPRSSRPSTTSSPRSRASPSRNSPAPSRR